MREVQLYISGERIVLFKDEVISITQTIQNIKDPAKIFTDFSKTFTIPANKANNKLFKHYYNFDILNGFDARLKVDAEIKLNHVSFRKGYIKLEGVDLKDNKAYSYRVTFFGSTVSLKDILGEDKLNALTWLNNFELTYSGANIKTYLQNGYSPTVSGTTYTNAIVTPLISHTDRMYYDTTSGHETVDNWQNNVYYHTGSGHDHGVLWSNLKYSIRVHLIIKAIEEQYGITFSTDFFTSSNLDYYNLYMWMHRKKGDVQGSATGLEYYSKLVDSFSSIVISPNVSCTDGTTFEVTLNSADYIDSQVILTPVATTIPYNAKIYRNGVVYAQKTNVTNTQTFYLDSLPDGNYNIYVECLEALTFSNIYWEFKSYADFILIETLTSNSSTVNILVTFTFYPTQQLPEIKIIDFLTGLFKMFNLTAYIENDIIVVDTLDNFYATFNEYDITKYTDVNSSSVDLALPFKQIIFAYEDYKTYLAAIFNQLNAQEFGELKYKGEDALNYGGSDYNITLPFQKIMYERLTNLNGGAYTTIQYGWMADDNMSSYIGKPLIHYVNRQTSGTALSFRDTATSHSSVSTYFIPLNSNGITGSEQSLNFNAEIDEYALTTNTETLFANYYINYIQDIFKIKKRLFKLKAFLPLKILLNFNLSDRFIINGKRFKINSINTNLQTGESQLELLNEL
jgi:hypothetical protein